MVSHMSFFFAFIIVYHSQKRQLPFAASQTTLTCVWADVRWRWLHVVGRCCCGCCCGLEQHRRLAGLVLMALHVDDDIGRALRVTHVVVGVLDGLRWVGDLLVQATLLVLLLQCLHLQPRLVALIVDSGENQHVQYEQAAANGNRNTQGRRIGRIAGCLESGGQSVRGGVGQSGGCEDTTAARVVSPNGYAGRVHVVRLHGGHCGWDGDEKWIAY